MAKPISDEELQLKVRARHRLIGAITLVVAMIVVIPMVFDSTPRKEKSEISIQIPAPDNPPPFNSKLESSKAEKPVSRGPVDVRPPSASQPANAVTEQPVSVEKNSTAGQPEEARPATEVATAKPASADKFVVQLGVFANPDNAKQVEAKLKENDIHYYTEVLKSPAGAVRVRAGPFDSRADAEEARTKLKLAGLSGGVVIGE
jgi:DedD protein